MTGQDVLRICYLVEGEVVIRQNKQTETPQQISAIYLQGKGRLLVESGTLVNLLILLVGLGGLVSFVEAQKL